MEWTHKGIRFTIRTQPMGPLYLASARAPRKGLFVRVRPFSAIGTSEDAAVDLLKQQIELEYRSVPD